MKVFTKCCLKLSQESLLTDVLTFSRHIYLINVHINVINIIFAIAAIIIEYRIIDDNKNIIKFLYYMYNIYKYNIICIWYHKIDHLLCYQPFKCLIIYKS